MHNIVLDFRRNYERGDRLEADGVAYQNDIGRGLEAYVPEEEVEYILQCGFENDPALTVVDIDDISPDAGGGYKLSATIPDDLLEKSGDLLVYVVAAGEGVIITKYEGKIQILRKAIAERITV